MRIYFIGICGTAMGNAALLLRRHGHSVSGSDGEFYPPMSTLLMDSGVRILEGYDAGRLQRGAPDLVVVGNALGRGNPEIEWLLETKGFPFTSLPALLHDQFLKNRFNIVVTGTHGKTTTTDLTALLLQNNGTDPGYFMGGIPFDLPEGAHLGAEEAPFVIEGDEYDSAFFDKRSKFIHYAPSILIVNNLEFDHCDVFRDLKDMQRSFLHLLRIVPANGRVLLNGDDPNATSLLPVNWAAVHTVGRGGENDLRITNFGESPEGSSFNLEWHGRPWRKVKWPLGGFFNARNAAMAALAAGFALFPENPTNISLDSLQIASGVKRRQELILSSEGLKVVEDFGHHPTAIAQTLESLRRRFRSHQLIACFEPRCNTSRTNIFQKEFASALSKANAVFLGPVNRADQLQPEKRLDTAALAKSLKARGISAFCFKNNQSLLSDLISKVGNPNKKTGEKCLVCFFSNGSFDGIIKDFVSQGK